jgi:hypothetical protein
LPSTSSRKLGTHSERCHPSESRHATGWGVAGTTQRRQGGDWKGCSSVCGPGGKYSGRNVYYLVWMVRFFGMLKSLRCAEKRMVFKPFFSMISQLLNTQFFWSLCYLPLMLNN